MKKMKMRIVFVFMLAFLSGGLLLYTSQSVQKAEDRLATLQISINNENNAIKVLKAEWAYLNNPERLEKLAKEFLSIEPIKPAQMVVDPDVFAPRPENNPALIEEILSAPMYQDVSIQLQNPQEQKPLTPQPVRKQPREEKSFDALLNELGAQ